MAKIALVFYVANLIAILASAADGVRKGYLLLRFEEREAITSISSIQLGCTALLGWLVFARRRSGAVAGTGSARRGSETFWLITAAGFLYLALDEALQFHEGMDSGVARAFGYSGNPMLDGLATGLYGVVAAVICYRYRSEILARREILIFFALGGVFLLLTSALNIGVAAPWQIILEESCKLMGVVSFLLGHLAAFRSTYLADPARARPPP
jgi:hypothetical protein